MKGITLVLSSVLASCLIPARAQEHIPQASGKENARAVIRDVIQAVIERSIKKTPDGQPYALLMLMTPTAEEQKRVHKLGGIAVAILAEYAKDEDVFHQRVALRLLSLFKSDAALAALLEFTDHSRIRQEAVAIMCVYPREKVQLDLEKFAASDSDLDVRKAAKRCLDSYKNAR